MSNGMKIELAVFFLLTTALGTLWYYGWVKPADEARLQILECMSANDDLSYESYEECVRRSQY